MNIIKTILPVFFVTISFCSCKKSSDENTCAPTVVLNITGPGTVTQGWNAVLSIAYAEPNYTYFASGPNGWSVQLSGRQVIKTNMQLQDAGTYFIRSYNSQNCMMQEGSHAVTVTTIQNAPCEGTLTNNSSTTNFPGLSSFNYSSVTFTPDITNSKSTVTGLTAAPIPANTYLALIFSGTNIPKPGKYKTIYAYNAAGVEDEVAVHFNDGTTNKLYLSAVGQDVYVTLVNGKTQICFCNLAVSYTISGIPYYISGKITIN